MRLILASALFLVLPVTGCGDDGTPPADDSGMLMTSPCPGPGCTVTGTIASCSVGYACTIPVGDGDVECGAGSSCVGMCGDSCDVDCTDGAMCDIQTGNSTSSSCDASDCIIEAGESASYDCTNGATCDVTAGAGSSLNCDSGSTCDFVCTSTCGVQCRGDSTCTIQCPGDEAPRDFTGEVSCE